MFSLWSTCSPETVKDASSYLELGPSRGLAYGERNLKGSLVGGRTNSPQDGVEVSTTAFIECTVVVISLILLATHHPDWLVHWELCSEVPKN